MCECAFRRAKETKQGRTGGEGAETADRTGEVEQPVPRDPVGGSGGPSLGLMAGQMARTSGREGVSAQH